MILCPCGFIFYCEEFIKPQVRDTYFFILTDLLNGGTLLERRDLYPVALALAGAALFGASAPASKVLLGVVDPVLLAGLLYLGSGIGLALLLLLRRAASWRGEARLTLRDIPWLAGSVLAGGIAAPILLMVSLQHTPAATASLLLTFECVATAAIAALVFREAIGRQVWVAIGLITLASTMLAVNLSGGFGISPGAIGIIGACLLWGIDNNLTFYISSRDPVAIGMIKGLGAGTFSLSLALLLGHTVPGPGAIAPALGIGMISYGLSIAMFIMASRGMGAARTSAWFGIAPFAGAVLSLLVFREFPGLQFVISVPFMVAGALLLFGEEHSHMHIHAPIEHEHYYMPDQHHPLKTSGPSRHRHIELRHSHPHRPDIHHRHEHEGGEKCDDSTRR
jgi:drug/metabolite transporter (DMT)-like permease